MTCMTETFAMTCTAETLHADFKNPNRPITRLRNAVMGVTLINPFLWDDCLLCKKGYYCEKDLRDHYQKDHQLDFSSAPVPRTHVQLQEFINQAPLGVSKTYSCGICGKNFSTNAELWDHKTVHVDPRFMRYICPTCGKRFLMWHQVEEHDKKHLVKVRRRSGQGQSKIIKKRKVGGSRNL